jgi:hypothetical protein
MRRLIRIMRPGLKALPLTLAAFWLFACSFAGEMPLGISHTASLYSHPGQQPVAAANTSVTIAPSKENIQSLDQGDLASATANFEPVLLLLFGSSLLLIAAGIKTVRSKKEGPDNNRVGG